MAKCDGIETKTGETCGRMLNRCKRCGHEGCNRPLPDDCSKQGFRHATCLGCGRGGFQRPVKD